MKNAAIHITGITVLLLSACAELQPVRTTPDFVTTAIKPGDQVELVTIAGERLKFEVTHVDNVSIGSPEHLIALQEIKELYLISKERPKVPCGGAQELGCSVPGKAKVLDAIMNRVIGTSADGIAGVLADIGAGSNWHSTYEEKFYYACLQHDFCYRHGYKTYGHNKETCDSGFYNDMVELCGIDAGCRAAAKEFGWAVTNHAEEGAYQTDTSTYCEYDGPPLNLGSENNWGQSKVPE